MLAGAENKVPKVRTVPKGAKGLVPKVPMVLVATTKQTFLAPIWFVFKSTSPL